jgi:hypothetical protein
MNRGFAILKHAEQLKAYLPLKHLWQLCNFVIPPCRQLYYAITVYTIDSTWLWQKESGRDMIQWLQQSIWKNVWHYYICQDHFNFTGVGGGALHFFNRPDSSVTPHTMLKYGSQPSNIIGLVISCSRTIQAKLPRRIYTDNTSTFKEYFSVWCHTAQTKCTDILEGHIPPFQGIKSDLSKEKAFSFWLDAPGHSMILMNVYGIYGTACTLPQGSPYSLSNHIIQHWKNAGFCELF